MRNRVVLALVGVLASAALAHAGPNDLVLSRLGTVSTSGTDVIANNQDFRSLVSELGVVLAPKFLSPADTLGFSGFQFSTELAFTKISSSSRFWCATEESDGCAAGQEKGSGYLSTLSVFARKGIWLPLPSFELGAGVMFLNGSNMWSGQAYAKFALHEGFHDWPIPSVAVRGAASRLFGSEQLDLTIASFDVSASKSFGIQGTINLEPYIGWNLLWIIPRSEVIDKTPEIDAGDPANMADIRMNFVFPDQTNVARQRFFGGVKVKYYVFAFTAEVNFALAGNSVDNQGAGIACDVAAADQQNICDAQDKAGSQATYALSLSLDF